LFIIREWASDGGLIVDTEDYKDVSSNMDEYSDFSYDHTNGMDWYFPVVLELCQNSQWLLFENNFSLNESSISEICNMLKNKIICELQTEIFLQHPLIIQVPILNLRLFISQYYLYTKMFNHNFRN